MDAESFAVVATPQVPSDSRSRHGAPAASRYIRKAIAAAHISFQSAVFVVHVLPRGRGAAGVPLWERL